MSKHRQKQQDELAIEKRERVRSKPEYYLEVASIYARHYTAVLSQEVINFVQSRNYITKITILKAIPRSFASFADKQQVLMKTEG